MHIDEAIEILTKLITKNVDAADAMRYAQAALNLAHVKSVLHNIENSDE